MTALAAILVILTLTLTFSVKKIVRDEHQHRYGQRHFGGA